MGTKRRVSRSSRSGQFVTPEEAAADPAHHTVEEVVGGDEAGDQEVERDTATGEFVTEEYAKEHPDTTQVDHV